MKDLPEVRQQIANFVDESTVLLGHGLENDLRAMRILHPRIVDTALLFPHPKGLPFRQSLRLLSSKVLNRSIQEGPADQGHSSVEDAKAAMDLIKWKVLHDRRSPFDQSANKSGLAWRRGGLLSPDTQPSRRNVVAAGTSSASVSARQPPPTHTTGNGDPGDNPNPHSVLKPAVVSDPTAETVQTRAPAKPSHERSDKVGLSLFIPKRR